MDDGNGVLYNMVFRGYELSYVAINLTPGISYSFKVSVVNFNGEGPLSTPVAIQSCVVPIGVMQPTLMSST